MCAKPTSRPSAWVTGKGSASEHGPRSSYTTLSEDPGETKNVADQLPNVVAKIEEILKKARVATPDYPIKALDGSGG